MEAKKVLSRENIPTDELQRSAEKVYKGLKLAYIESYYLDDEVNEDTGIINKEKKVRHYTKEQINRNMKALKSAYLIAKGAASPDEIIEFRNKVLCLFYRLCFSSSSIKTFIFEDGLLNSFKFLARSQAFKQFSANLLPS